MNKYSWLGIESFWFCELQFMWSSTHILYYFVFSWPELQFSKPHDEHGTSTSPTNNLWWRTEIISVKGRFHFVMYLFTMAVISFLTSLILMCFNYFPGNELAYQPLWTGICYMYMLESNKNDQLFSCSAFGSMTWRSLFGFQFINWVKTFDFTNMCVLWYYGTCWDLQTEEDNNASLPTISAFMQN